MGQMLSEQTAAKRLGVSRFTLMRARHRGEVKFYQIGKRRVLYSQQQLVDYMASVERQVSH
jgi:excisionase family DNA binding protein